MDRTSYDSTWEEDEDDGDAEHERSSNNVQARKNTQAPRTSTRLQNRQLVKSRYEYSYMDSSAARDMQNYRHGYRHSGPSYHIDPKEMPNLRFYRNEIEFKPNGCLIEDFLSKGKNDYKMLEYNHNYIQWLFPLQERGVNPQAIPLHEKEIEEMKNDRRVMRNLLEAYKLMLGFYGLHLESEETGKVRRSGDWEKRYINLNNHTHNNLRITRILKCLGELGFEHFQAPLVKFFLEETLCHGKLKNTKKSVLDYFMFSVKDKKQRQGLVRFAWKHYDPQCEFVWGPVDLLRNDQEDLRKRTRGNCDLIREEHGEDQMRPPKIKKENGQDDEKEPRDVKNEKEPRDVNNGKEPRDVKNGKEPRDVNNEKEPRDVNGCRCGTWMRSLGRKNSRNVQKKRREVEPLQNKPVNSEKKVTSQGNNRKRSGCFNCLPL